MKLLLVISLTWAFDYLAYSQSSNEWRNIRPLHTTRAEVERLLGPPSGQCKCVYEVENETIRIDYSSGPCKGLLSGWNVPADTVLRVNIAPVREQKFTELGIDVSKYVKITDDSFTDYYGNRDVGIRYTVSPTGIITGISYFPSTGDKYLRCPGFPSEDSSVIDYKPFDQYFTSMWDRSQARLDNFAVSLQEKSDFKGHVITYAGKRACRGEASAYANRIKNYLVNERGIGAKRLKVIDGGYREEFTTDLFLIPSAWPAPVASPTLPPREVHILKRCKKRIE